MSSFVCNKRDLTFSALICEFRKLTELQEAELSEHKLHTLRGLTVNNCSLQLKKMDIDDLLLLHVLWSFEDKILPHLCMSHNELS